MKPSKPSAALARDDSAFTRMDFLAVLVTLSILSLLILPTLARNRVKPQGTLCLNNLRQLCLAWGMYANENNDKIMSNPASVSGGIAGVNTTNRAWVYGYLGIVANVSDNTNSALLTNGLMGLYVNQTALFKCPNDYWQCQEGGQLMNRVRSYSMNYCMEGDSDDAAKIALGYPLNETLWAHGFSRYSYHKVTDPGGRLPGPAPASAWVFCDEHPDSINNGCLAWGNSSGWADTPASYHESGDNFGFADGHVEYHKWLSGYNASQDTGICKPVTLPTTAWNSPGINLSPNNLADYSWVTAHATASYP